MNLARLNRLNNDSIDAAGPRYTPRIDADAPNLEVADLVECFDTLALSGGYRDRVNRVRADFNAGWRDLPKEIKELVESNQVRRLSTLLERLAREKAGRSESTIRELKQISSQIESISSEYLHELYDQERQVERNSTEHHELLNKQRIGREFQNVIGDVYSFTHSHSLRLVNNNKLLLLGEWGTGKTHTLCDFTEQVMSQGLPIVFTLAHHLRQDCNPLEAIANKISPRQTLLQLLSSLNTIGRQNSTRVLIIVDGINEADRKVWKKSVKQIAETLDRYKNVGLVLSCRSPFEQQIFSKKCQADFTTVYHRGFTELEFDAQKSFFQYYEIPVPQYPLMTPEFSRPLFLKILCKTLAGKTATTKSKWLKDISSGQRTMTKIFEDFVNEIGSVIEIEFSLPAKTCWKILKEYRGGQNVTGVAVKMAEAVSDHLLPQQCEEIVKEVTGTSLSVSRRILDRIKDEGLLVEDYVWENATRQIIIRFPYQRFSDHLIARYLLNQYLNVSNENSVRRSFYSNRPLGKIFSLERGEHVYAMPGLASAVVTEFPERVKRVLPDEKRELVYYLPKKQRLLNPYKEVFLDGVMWRSKDSFTEQTDFIFGQLIDRQDGYYRNEVLEILVTLACRQGHPYSANRLYNYLANKTMADRDILWSEYVRQTSEGSVVQRVLEWAFSLEDAFANKEVAKNYVILLSLFLTTTNRDLRDKATRSLVLIGEKVPDILFEHTLSTFNFNDIYVRERLLAACYGVLMRRWAFASASLKKHTVKFVRSLYDELFSSSASFSTTHYLVNDYSMGIMSLARLMDKNALGKRRVRDIKHKSASSSVRLPRPQWIRSKTTELVQGAIRMDFGNYTIGRLVEGRRNYDADHKEYVGVTKQIKWRMANLGYRTDIFEEIDSRISDDDFRRSRSGIGKIDRYGKKYAWIAFYEIAGIKAAQKLLPDRYDARISDCDIDPSFPDDVRDWSPTIKNLFRSRYTTPEAWVKSRVAPDYSDLFLTENVDDQFGPWALLDGYISESSSREDDPRRCFTFIKGLFVKESDIRKLKYRFNIKDYPGNREIPDPVTDYYTFSGEIPWSKNFGHILRDGNGKARRHLENCFSIRKDYKYTKKYKNLTAYEQVIYGTRNHRNILDALNGLDIDSEIGNEIEPDPNELIELDGYKTIPGVEVEVPHTQFGWETYHSSENQVAGADAPAPALCDFLELKKNGSNQDLYDKHNNPASLYRSFRRDSEYFRSNLLYLRKDLCKQYLKSTGQRLVWIIWGERDFDTDKEVERTENMRKLWNEHRNIHRRIMVARL